MSKILRTPRRQRFAITPERMLAAGAMTIVAVGLAQPSVRTLAGLDFSDQKFAAAKIDPTPTGSVAAGPEQSHAERAIHGLTGILKRIRDKN